MNIILHRLWYYLLDRLDERSTWVWIVTAIIAVTASSVSPEIQALIINVGMAIGALLVGILLPDGRLVKRDSGVSGKELPPEAGTNESPERPDGDSMGNFKPE